MWELLPIPEFDGGDSLRLLIAYVGGEAAAGVERELENLRQRYPRLTVTIARREIRKWLRESAEGQRVEGVVGALLGEGCKVRRCGLDGAPPESVNGIGASC